MRGVRMFSGAAAIISTVTSQKQIGMAPDASEYHELPADDSSSLESPREHAEEYPGLEPLHRLLPNLKHDYLGRPQPISSDREAGVSYRGVCRSQPNSRRPSEDHKVGFTSKYIIPATKWAYEPLLWNKSTPLDSESHQQYKIEYLVFQMGQCSYMGTKGDQEVPEDGHGDENTDASILVDPEKFEEIVADIKQTLLVKEPQLMVQGSSGSYLVYSSDGLIAGIFKPKDEEPYGPLSPKWTKWMHRTFFPCFFGRLCLIPNLGYISEAAASVLDRRLGSKIVPYTGVVSMSLPSFYYGYWTKNSRPQKSGSLQLFLHGYTAALVFLTRFPVPEMLYMETIGEVEMDLDVEPTSADFRWNHKTLEHFREELEKLVLLDYIMRNTDRGLDNWMVKIVWIETKRDQKTRIMEPRIRIGAIDSGLSFPWKHPDEWRLFPYGWLFLPLNVIGHPFSERTRRHYLPLLTLTEWWEETAQQLQRISKEDKDFSPRMWKKQLAVLKGQAFNVVEVLKFSHLGPLELTRRENVLVLDCPVKWSEHPEQETAVNDRTPLLGPLEDLVHVSGFDYNVSYTQDNPCTKLVYVERLVIPSRKLPIFTWC